MGTPKIANTGVGNIMKSGIGQSSPIEVCLRQSNMYIGCSVTCEDESGFDMHINSLSVRGAQREVTTFLIQQGYTPAGRWEDEVQDGNGRECFRRFKITEPSS
ncbi:MAG: hypothetical protein QOE58_1819 [Actinomycetota bacterium]|nr:hypothetical protein [Actinomycetota bacterium]